MMPFICSYRNKNDTGAKSGLGYKTSKVFMNAGATVILACRHVYNIYIQT